MSPIDEILQIENRHYILATSPRVDERARILKHGDTFLVCDRYGDVRPIGLGEEGLYHEGTRFLSRLVLRLDGRHPLLLSSTVREDNALLSVDLTNADIFAGEHLTLRRDTLHLWRSCLLWGGALYTRLRARNFAPEAVDVILELAFDADYVDIFEIRGEERARRGHLLPARHGREWVELGYVGLDNVIRHTRIEFTPAPLELSASRARLSGKLPPGGEREYFLTVVCRTENEREAKCVSSFGQALDCYSEAHHRSTTEDAVVASPNGRFNAWLRRSAADLHLMLTQTPQGPYPYAGIPWFNAPFGRDGIISALEYLWVSPEPARGVLRFLASHQATEVDPERDAEPGKILHEMRGGEMARLGEIPFGCYYGTVDATPLFVLLAGAYYERTADLALIGALWPNIERALHWIEEYGDPDRDGFVEYSRRSRTGLVTQGWKDSHDSVFHRDGALAEPPVALCEVQAYAYAAWRSGANLARVLGRAEAASDLEQRADQLRSRFEEAFWLEDLSTYALALDGSKRPCRVRTSNAGHCLWAGIASAQRARRVAQTLLNESSFSGWGIRTVAAGESRYNPMSYHNGSVWPHDNALVARGLAAYGLNEQAAGILRGFFEVSQVVDLQRMPELFCGFVRRAGEGPTLYPVACAPQTWAAASVFLMLQACLGLQIDAPAMSIRFTNPVLPDPLRELSVQNLAVGGAAVDLMVHRHSHDVGISVTRRRGNVEIVVVK